MHRSYSLFVPVLFSFLLTGCSLSSLDDHIIVPDVEDEFYLSLWEAFTPQGRILEFRLRTIEDAECANSNIAYDIRQLQGTISLSINEIRQNGECQPGQAPATASPRVGILQGGYYSLEVGLRKTVSSEGQLAVTQEAYNMSLETGGGVVLLDPQLRRIPRESIWGFVSYEGGALKDTAEQLVHDIQGLCEAQALKNGYYGYFTVQNGKVRFPNTVAPEGALAFQYRLVKSEDSLISLLESYRSEYGSGLTVKVFDTLGNEF